MKTAVKLNASQRVDISPQTMPDGLPGVMFSVNFLPDVRDILLTPDQCGALIFGLEMALEVQQVQREAVAG